MPASGHRDQCSAELAQTLAVMQSTSWIAVHTTPPKLRTD